MDEIKTKVLFTITDKGKNRKIINLFNRLGIKYSFVLNGYGTASSSLLGYFGLEEIEKRVIVSVIPENMEGKVLSDLHNKIKIYEPGKGIAFTSRIHSASRYFSTIYEGYKGDEIMMEKDKEYELIVLIVSEGYAEKAMEAAKRKKAGGGTLIKGIGLGTSEATKILGITIEPEKDIVLILSEKDTKKDIMKEISETVGLSEEGRGICFSIPVENVVGLDQNILFK
jgi:nitrogen regulatory protein PII